MPVRVTIAVGQDPAEIRAAVLGLAAISLAQMRLRALPRLYDGSIRYAREPAGRERWQTARETAQRGQGDCEDLAAYRVAELHRAGETAATIIAKVIRPNELMHIMVRRANGSIEDPSAYLGMKGKG
jgi:predicted transglutaminase-like cysteine proteinase